MEHVVFFPAQDGTPAFRRLATLEEAVRLVEHLRNVEGVNEVSVHALTEVPLAFKAYYRVEVPADAPAQEAAPVGLAPEPFPSFAVPSIVPDLALVPAVVPDVAAAPEAEPAPVDLVDVAAGPAAVEVAEAAEQPVVADLVPEQATEAAEALELGETGEPAEAVAAGSGQPAERSRTLGFFTS